MKYAALAAATVLALAVPFTASAQIAGTSSVPKADDVQSGGHNDSDMAAATGGLQSSTTGAGDLNGPFRNGQPDGPYPTNKAEANMRGVGHHLDPDAPAPQYVGQGSAQ